jgi:hypothetical protein
MRRSICAGALLAIGMLAVLPLETAAADPMGIAALLPPAGTVFPVRGAVVYGQGEARYGADRGTRARTCSRRPARRSWPCGT